MKPAGCRTIVSIVIALLCLLPVGAAYSADGNDSAHVRTPQPPEKSFGKTILDATSTVLKLPYYPVKGMVYGATWTATRSPLKDLFRFELPVRAAYPVISYGSNQSLAGGLGFYTKNNFHHDDIIQLRGQYSFENYQAYRFAYKDRSLFGEHLGLRVKAAYDKRTRESFYGLGNTTEESDEVAYGIEESRFEIALLWHFRQTIEAEFFAQYDIHNTFDGQNDDRPSDLDSIAERLSLDINDYRSSHYWIAGVEFTHDRRDNPGQPKRGGRQTVLIAYAHGTGACDSLEFYHVRLEYGHYFQLFDNRILMVRTTFERYDRDESACSIPFYLRSALGGKEALLGYRAYRFVDNDLALVSLEYRYPLWRVLDGIVFFEEGRVFKSIIDDFVFNGWRYSLGMGIRAWNKNGEIARLLVAASREGARFYLQLGMDW